MLQLPTTFFIKVQPSGKGGKKTNFVFKISLHIDDIATLQKIQLVLSQLAGKRVGNVTISKLSASLTILDLQVLKSNPAALGCLPVFDGPTVLTKTGG